MALNLSPNMSESISTEILSPIIILVFFEIRSSDSEIDFK